MDIKIKKLTRNAIIPTRGSAAAAGYDLYAATFNDEPLEDCTITIEPHTTILIGTGLAVEITDPNKFLGIYARSGLASKKGLRPVNCVGVIDADYRGEIKIALHNDTNEAQIISCNERIAQMILQDYTPMNFIEVDQLNDTQRGTGGFGSTGNK